MERGVDLSSGWKTFEVTYKNSEGSDVQPFFDQLSISGVPAKPPITKMRIIDNIGWAQAIRVMKDSSGSKVIVKKEDSVWLVKCKPSCWRLYCYVLQKEKWIIYVYAVCKKQTEEDSASLRAAKRIVAKIQSRAYSIAPFEFPSD